MIFSLQAFEADLPTDVALPILLAKTQACHLKLIFIQSGSMLGNYSEAYLISSSGKQPPAQKLEGSSEAHQLRKKSFGR